MTIKKEILDELIKGYRNPEDLPGENGLLKQLTKQLLERAMQSGLTHQPGYSKNEAAPLKQANRRNGASFKKVKISAGQLQIEVPRDRAGEFEPIIPRSINDALTALITTLFHCIHAAYQCAIFRLVYKRFMESRSCRCVFR